MEKEINEMKNADAMNVLSQKARLEAAKQRFQEKWEYIKATIPDGPELAYAKDFDPVRAERRAEAVVNMMDAAKELVLEICPDIPGMFAFEDDWLEHNLMPFAAYDYLERKSFLTLACSIWMLDELLMQKKCFDGNHRFPSLEQMCNEISTPSAWDAIHETKSLVTMVWIIQHRNDDCIGMMVEQNEELPARFFMDQYMAANMLDQKVASRRRFEKILDEIPQEHIDEAVELYKATFEDILQRIYKSRAVIAQKQLARIEQEGNADGFQLEVVEFRSMLGSICVTPPDVLAHLVGSEIAEIWADFEITDPYSLCFAFLYLLEIGDDMPWVYSVSLPLMEMCASVLPWGNEQLNDDGDSRLDHYMEDEALNEVPDLGNWFDMIYENVDEMDMGYRCSCNLAQMVYWTTEGILPRNAELVWVNHNGDDLFGETALRDLNPHAFWMHIIEACRPTNPVFHFAPTEVEKLNEEKEECLEALEEVEREVHRYRQELASMRNLLLSLQDGSYEDDTAEEDFELPYTIQKYIAVFGGDDTWVKEIKSMVEDVIFIAPDEELDAETICEFDAIWIQTDAMSHRTYFKVTDLAHEYEIPVEYFSYASALKCAEQLAVYDMEE